MPETWVLGKENSFSSSDNIQSCSWCLPVSCCCLTVAQLKLTELTGEHLPSGPSSALYLLPRSLRLKEWVLLLWISPALPELPIYLSCSATVFLPAVCQARCQWWIIKWTHVKFGKNYFSILGLIFCFIFILRLLQEKAQLNNCCSSQNYKYICYFSVSFILQILSGFVFWLYRFYSVWIVCSNLQHVYLPWLKPWDQ